MGGQDDYPPRVKINQQNIMNEDFTKAAQTADLTNLIVTGCGAAGTVVTFVDAVSGLRANLDTAGKQVSWQGGVYLPVAGTISVDPTGTGATALNLVTVIEYFACVTGGTLI